jgi:periplasmic divalent cation tolerance protein
MSVGEATAPALVWCPFPEADSAAEVATTLLDEELIACANILPAMRSLYVWRGERSDEAEVGVLFKTNRAKLDRLTIRLTDLHPYDEPAILAWDCDHAAPHTAAWLERLGLGGLGA